MKKDAFDLTNVKRIEDDTWVMYHHTPNRCKRTEVGPKQTNTSSRSNRTLLVDRYEVRQRVGWRWKDLEEERQVTIIDVTNWMNVVQNMEQIDHE